MSEIIAAEQKGWMDLFVQIRKQQVILTASSCLIALAIVLKNILGVLPDILIKEMMMYTIIYFGFLVFAFRPDGPGKSVNSSPLAWDVLVVIITIAIIAVHAW